jgi:hypothetical protein
MVEVVLLALGALLRAFLYRIAHYFGSLANATIRAPQAEQKLRDTHRDIH